jgi:DNA polymerase-3 subunit epsilon
MRYLAIHFETANSNRSSICAFGYALFEDGNVIAQGADLCRPAPNFYDAANTAAHGITQAVTDNLPGFGELITKIDGFHPDFIAAHNASFEISCLRHWCDQAGEKYPVYPYVCTLHIFRELHPEISHTLANMCQLYGIQLNMQDFSSDALACGWLMQKAFASTGSTSLASLCDKLAITPGQLLEHDYTPCGSYSTRRQMDAQKEKISDITSELDDDASMSGPLYGAIICFTGALSIPRTEAARKAAARGAIPQDNVTPQTKYLVVGINDFIGFESGFKTGKMKRAEAYRGKGQDLEIISEDEFTDLLRQ